MSIAIYFPVGRGIADTMAPPVNPDVIDCRAAVVAADSAYAPLADFSKIPDRCGRADAPIRERPKPASVLPPGASVSTLRQPPYRNGRPGFKDARIVVAVENRGGARWSVSGAVARNAASAAM
ncbi:MAG: hypothetical protein JSS42_08940 [Proteobacteria bacterium]|nr:hypothetical protein [Pseudomonadota bacterium]